MKLLDVIVIRLMSLAGVTFGLFLPRFGKQE